MKVPRLQELLTKQNFYEAKLSLVNPLDENHVFFPFFPLVLGLTCVLCNHKDDFDGLGLKVHAE